MKVLLHIDITETVWVPYESSLRQWAKAMFPDIIVLNVDNHSSLLLVQQSVQLIKEAKQFLLFFDNPAHNTVSLGVVMKILQTVPHHTFQSQSYQMILLGKHPIIEKMGKVLGEDKFLQTFSLPEAEQNILVYFNE